MLKASEMITRPPVSTRTIHSTWVILKYRPSNITIKKIPQVVLGKCEFGKNNYDLNIINSAMETDEDMEEDE